MMSLKKFRLHHSNVFTLHLLGCVSKEFLHFIVHILNLTNVLRRHCNRNNNGSSIIAIELRFILIVKIMQVVRVVQIYTDSRKYFISFILIIHYIIQKTCIDSLKHNMILTQTSHLLCNLVNFLERLRYLYTKGVDTVHVKPFVHQFFPKI